MAGILPVLGGEVGKQAVHVFWVQRLALQCRLESFVNFGGHQDVNGLGFRIDDARRRLGLENAALLLGQLDAHGCLLLPHRTSRAMGPASSRSRLPAGTSKPRVSL